MGRNWVRVPRAEIGSGYPGKKRYKCLFLSGGKLRGVHVESHRAAQQSGKWERVPEGGAGIQVTLR